MRVTGSRMMLIILTMAVALVTTCSCAPERLPVIPGYAGTPTSSGVPLQVEGGGEASPNAWFNDGVLVVTTMGSGSCPWIPTITTIDDEARVVTLSLSVVSRDACTANSGPHTVELTTDQNLTGYLVVVELQRRGA